MRLPMPRLSGFQLHVSQLTLATVVSQAVLFGGSLVLARLFDPTEFGAFSVAFALATAVAILATGRYDAAIPLPGKEAEASRLAWLAIALAALVSVVFFVIVLGERASGGPLGDWFGAGSAIWLVPVTVFALALWSVLRGLQSRAGNFHAIGRSSITSAVVQTLGQIAGGIASWGALGLMAGFTLGRISNAASLAPRSGLGRPVGIRDLATTARDWRRFPALVMTPAFLTNVSVAAIAPLVSALYGVTFAGLFSFATRILAVPSALIGQAVALVFFPKAASMERAGTSMRDPIERAAMGLTVISVPVFGLTLLAGPEIFALVFGERWREAGVIAAVLSPWLALNFISSPLSSFATVKDKLGRLFATSVVETTSRIAAMCLGVVTGSSMSAVVAYSIVGCAISIYFVAWVLRLCGSSIWSWLDRHKWYFLGFGAAYAVVLAIDAAGSPVATLAATLTVTVAGGFYALWWMRSSMRGRTAAAPPDSLQVGDLPEEAMLEADSTPHIDDSALEPPADAEPGVERTHRPEAATRARPEDHDDPRSQP